MANIEPCNWEVGAAGGAAQLRKVADAARALLDSLKGKMQEFEQGAREYLDMLNWIPGAKRFIDFAFNCANRFIDAVNKAVQAVFDVIEDCMAPWVIRAVGNAMVDQFDSKFGEFHEKMEKVNFKGAYSWEGKAGEYYGDNVAHQAEHGVHATHQRVTDFAKAVQTLGDDAVSSVQTFIWSTIGGFIAIGKEASGLKTAKLAVEKFFKGASLAFAIAATVYALIKFAMSVSAQCAQFLQSAPQSLRPWPKGAVTL